jgi:uncharacterized protein
MISLQRFLTKDEKFFDLLESSVSEVQKSVEILAEITKEMECTTASVSSIEKFNRSRRNETRIAQEITEELCKTFITPLEREDIESLSSALYKIPKTLEKFTERLTLFQGHMQSRESFLFQIEILELAAETLSQMIKSLRRNPKLEVIKSQNERLLALESDGDKLLLEMTWELIQRNDKDPINIFILKDLYDLLERAIDKMRDAGSIIFRIILKNS